MDGSKRSSRANLVLLASVALGACGSESVDTFEYTTETIELVAHAQWPLCGGSVHSVDDAVTRARQRQGLTGGPPVRVHVGPSAPAMYCEPEDTDGGCAWGFGDDARGAVASPRVAIREALRVVRRQHHLQGPPVFEEAIAVLDRDLDRPPFTLAVGSSSRLAPSSLLQVTEDEYDEALHYEGVMSTAHFFASLMESAGEDAVYAFFGSPAFRCDAPPEALPEAFEEAFGVSLAEAEAQWLSVDASEYRRGSWCTPDNTLAWSDEGLELQTEVDCEGNQTLGPFVDDDGTASASTLVGCVDLLEDRDVRVTPSGRGRSLTIQPDGCPPHADASRADYHYLDVGSDRVYTLGGCTYALWLSTDYAHPDDLQQPAASTVRLRSP